MTPHDLIEWGKAIAAVIVMLGGAVGLAIGAGIFLLSVIASFR